MKKEVKRTAKKAVRRKARKKTRSGNRGLGFFAATVFVLIFALAYFFAGDLFLPERYEPVFSAEGEIIVSFLDVGQGDAIVIRTEYNAVLIDAGDHRNRAVVSEYLNNAGITFIDYVVATHPHADHIGGMPPILRDFEIGRLLMADSTNDTQTFENLLDAILHNNVDTHFPEPGEVFRAGLIELYVLAPPRGRFNSINDSSIVLRMAHGYTSFLFTGDAERASEQWMVENIGDRLRSDVLKVGHHGSRTSTTEAFLQAVSPSIAVIQVGDNQWGHPHADVLERLEYHGVAIYRNDQLGTIRMITDGHTIFFP